MYIAHQLAYIIGILRQIIPLWLFHILLLLFYPSHLNNFLKDSHYWNICPHSKFLRNCFSSLSVKKKKIWCLPSFCPIKFSVVKQVLSRTQSSCLNCPFLCLLIDGLCFAPVQGLAECLWIVGRYLASLCTYLSLHNWPSYLSDAPTSSAATAKSGVPWPSVALM